MSTSASPDAATRQHVLGELAGSTVDYGRLRPVVAAFEEQVDRSPQRRALSYAATDLSYRQLDELANGLAAELAECGVRRGDVVPVVMINGLEMPIAYLALMKLGAAFVPCDPAWPADRLADALDVVASRLVLRTRDVVLPAQARSHVVDAQRIAPLAQRPGVVLGPDDVVYGVFTSGTTGTPRCALNVHRGLANRFEFMTRYFTATDADVVLQNSKHTFDSSVWQLFWPLTIGARTVVPEQGEFLNLEHTVAVIAAHGITITDFVPAIFNMMVAMVESDSAVLGRLRSLRHLVVGGEEINPRAVHRLRALLPGLGVTNGYGPSEASIGMVFHAVEHTDGDHVPLGRPIDNCFAVVVDETLTPVPVGGVGEIVIAGACLGTGYLGDPDRTAEVFVDNPFPEIPGGRLYRTGDLGYHDDAGRLCFVGRRDQQVKIGGVRIELGEIEVAADRCPGVRHAKVLLARRGMVKSLALVAAGDDTVTPAALRVHLARALPRTSLPQHYFLVSEMPVTDNGKIDRQALQQLVDRRLAEQATALAAPPVARAFCERIAHVLGTSIGTSDFGADDDFRLRGGDSIRAVSAVLELRASLGVDVGVQDLLACPTPRALSERLAERLRCDPAAAEDDATLMERDAVLPMDLAALTPGEPNDAVGTVFVTGGTGFVGSRAVHQLLSTTPARVICLIRAADDAGALARVVQSLSGQGLWHESYRHRLAAYAGDLGKPQLGLGPADWDELAAHCDAVLHIGALVNFLFDYQAHRPANVLGTLEILRLCLRGRPKALHHVSTLGVLDEAAATGSNAMSEAFDPAVASPPTSGYSRSKWVAERLVLEARRSGVPVAIYRLGEVMPAADNGHPNSRALTHLLLSAFHQLGACPDVAIRSDYTPVADVAARLVAGVFDPEVRGRALHLFHGESVSYTDLLGPGHEPAPAADFFARLKAAAADADLPELGTLVALMTRRAASGVPDFGSLLTDNPRLFRRDECAKLDARHHLTDSPLGGAVDAYRRQLERRQPAPSA